MVHEKQCKKEVDGRMCRTSEKKNKEEQPEEHHRHCREVRHALMATQIDYSSKDQVAV